MEYDPDGTPRVNIDNVNERNAMLDNLLEPPPGLPPFTAEMMAEHCKDVLTRMYAEEGKADPTFDHEPMLLIAGRGGLTMMAIGSQLNSDEGKDLVMHYARELGQHKAVQYIGMTINAFTLAVDQKNDIKAQRGDGSLAWHPDRVEIVQVSIECRDGSRHLLRWEVTRDETSTTITPMETTPDDAVLAGRLTGFFKSNQE